MAKKHRMYFGLDERRGIVFADKINDLDHVFLDAEAVARGTTLDEIFSAGIITRQQALEFPDDCCIWLSDEALDKLRRRAISLPDAIDQTKLEELVERTRHYQQLCNQLVAGGDEHAVAARLQRRIALPPSEFRDAPLETRIAILEGVVERPSGDNGDRKENAGLFTVAQKKTFSELQPAVRKAYLSFRYAELHAGCELSDRNAYELLQSEGLSEKILDQHLEFAELHDYESQLGSKSFATWSKQVREARRPLGENKHIRRHGRETGSSVARRDEVE